MASGFSWGGGRSRCFSYWQEFQKCYAQTDTPTECVPQSEDYLECLHHTKALKREQAVEAEYKRRLEHHSHVQHNASPAPSGGGTTGEAKQEGKPEEPAK